MGKLSGCAPLLKTICEILEQILAFCFRVLFEDLNGTIKFLMAVSKSYHWVFGGMVVVALLLGWYSFATKKAP